MSVTTAPRAASTLGTLTQGDLPMRTTTRTRYLAALGLGLVLLFAAPARADDAPADIVSLLERARAAEHVEKDLAKAQALYEQVFAKAASTEAGREAGIRLLDLDADRTHEAWLTLIGTLSAFALAATPFIPRASKRFTSIGRTRRCRSSPRTKS